MDSSGDVRAKAAETLGKLGVLAKGARPVLIVASKDTQADVRANAVEALGRIPSPSEETVAALMKALKDDGERVRRNAAYALRNAGPMVRVSAPALAATLNDPSDTVRTTAAEVLADIAEQLQEVRGTSLILSLKSTLSAVDSVSPREAGRLRRSIQALEAMKAASWMDRLSVWTGNRWAASTVAVVFAYILWFIILRFAILTRWPLHVLMWNDALAPYTDFKMPDWLGGFKLPVRYVLLIGFFHYDAFVLDAWVKKWAKAAREQLEHRVIYQDRRTYISLPVRLEREIVSNLTAETPAQNL
jgi:hypothetical protein